MPITVRRLLFSVLAFASVLAFTGCGTTTSIPVAGQDSIRTLTLSANTNWVLAKWTSAEGEKNTIAQPAPTLSIGVWNRIGGHAGVNRYGVVISVFNDTIDWGAGIGATRMAGDPEIMAQEARYLDALQATRHVTIRKDRLVFTGPDSLKLEFVRAKP